MAKTEGVPHRHVDGTEHRHVTPGWKLGEYVQPDQDGTEPHGHGVPGDEAASTGGVIWTETGGEVSIIPPGVPPAPESA